MTDATTAPRGLMETSADAVLPRAVIGSSAERRIQRNGYRDRNWRTRAGTGELRIPKRRTDSYLPGVFAPPSAMIPPSACRPWQPDPPGPSR